MNKILVIEDEEVLLGILVAKLEKEGYHAEGAANGEEGLEKIHSFKPDLILLDMVMPKMNGFDVLEQKSRIPEFKNIPVIIISNSGQPIELDRAKKLGVADFLIKAEFTPDEVLEKVQTLLLPG